MQVTRLAVKHFRSVEDVVITPSAGLNLVVGDNGAGKTTLLEALHLLAHGRSFRGRVRDGLIKAGSAELEVFVEWREELPTGPRTRRAGLRHSGAAWYGRLDGEDVRQLGDLCAALAVITFEPGSHGLITGGGEARRRYVDWGLFHVERDFLMTWRRYARALRQRNALLKSRPSAAQLDAWDLELAEAGEPLARQRDAYLEALEPIVAETASELAPSLGLARIEHVPGWRRESMTLLDALLVSRERDIALGYSAVGPHRGDWRLEFSAVAGRSALSRGQAKLAALSALLAQARMHAGLTASWPVIALDDIASELDAGHRSRVFAWLARRPVQIFVTGTERPSASRSWTGPSALFHVEQGAITTSIEPAQ